VLVPEVTTEGKHKTGKKRPSDAALMAMAAERNTVDLVNICRELKGVWREERTDTAGGSFRFWTDKPDGGAKMVFGVNVAGGLDSPPNGQLDVCVRTDALSEVTGVSENSIDNDFLKLFLHSRLRSWTLCFALNLKEKLSN